MFNGLGDDAGLGLAAYPWLFPPKGFISIERNNFRVLAAGVTVLETIEPVAQGYDGYIRLLALASTDYALSFFTILSGGAALRDYTLVQTNIGAPETPKSVFIQLDPNLPLILQATATGVVGVRWSLSGWKYPVAQR